MEGNLRKVQLLELELLKTFKAICEAEKLTYYLIGGTLIGALRHNGFIPWDDDIDVGMPRDDYEKFIKCAKNYLSNEIVIKHYSLDSSYTDYPAKLISTKASFLIQREHVVREAPIWIDIFPLDGVPNQNWKKWIHLRKLDYFKMKMAFHGIDNLRIDKNRPIWKKALFRFAQIIPVGKLVDPVRTKRNIDRELEKYRVQDCKKMGNHVGAYKEREFVPVGFFENGSEVLFEGETFNAPKDADKYLTQIYGDYMSLPGVEERTSRHHVIQIKYNEKNEVHIGCACKVESK